MHPFHIGKSAALLYLCAIVATINAPHLFTTPAPIHFAYTVLHCNWFLIAKRQSRERGKKVIASREQACSADSNNCVQLRRKPTPCYRKLYSQKIVHVLPGLCAAGRPACCHAKPGSGLSSREGLLHKGGRHRGRRRRRGGLLQLSAQLGRHAAILPVHQRGDAGQLEAGVGAQRVGGRLPACVGRRGGQAMLLVKTWGQRRGPAQMPGLGQRACGSSRLLLLGHSSRAGEAAGPIERRRSARLPWLPTHAPRGWSATLHSSSVLPAAATAWRTASTERMQSGHQPPASGRGRGGCCEAASCAVVPAGGRAWRWERRRWES